MSSIFINKIVFIWEHIKWIVIGVVNNADTEERGNG